MDVFLAADIGGTNTRLAIMDSSGCQLESERFPTFSFPEAESFMEHLAERIISMISGYPEVCGAGFAVPGTVDQERKKLVYAPNLGWKNVALAEFLEPRISVPVLLENDANLAALGEFGYGELKDVRHGMLLTIGTGIGGGLVLDGQLYRGPGGLGVELGHMIIVKDGWQCNCGRRGCFEAYASAMGLIRLAEEKMSASGNPFRGTDDEKRTIPELIMEMHSRESDVAG
ncbi:MAG: ROK family protein, partial [Candidatus Wallbacteria bacterium]|nr:ROK family protein [Candidatus Wallbacteria bacterium]